MIESFAFIGILVGVLLGTFLMAAMISFMCDDNDSDLVGFIAWVIASVFLTIAVSYIIFHMEGVA